MLENKEVMKSFISPKIQVDHEEQANSSADANKTWAFKKPPSIVDLVEKYNTLLWETWEGLTSLQIQVDHEKQVNSSMDANKMWAFMKPLSVGDSVELVSWYVIAFVFNIFGGILGYFAVKDDDQNMANRLLIVGFTSLFLLLILGFSGVISLVW